VSAKVHEMHAILPQKAATGAFEQGLACEHAASAGEPGLGNC
jgi:hypothetical protein